ncbi:unnamed protein product [Owenia fusiformis]|uniref:Uncharacterized protein n=1 Tax=Owenia fusiformis TaxID=6347 RepID=A0A8S4NPT6_OWEFU|nr:unnamed protein product [Owenia fusiformis]
MKSNKCSELVILRFLKQREGLMVSGEKGMFHWESSVESPDSNLIEMMWAKMKDISQFSSFDKVLPRKYYKFENMSTGLSINSKTKVNARKKTKTRQTRGEKHPTEDEATSYTTSCEPARNKNSKNVTLSVFNECALTLLEKTITNGHPTEDEATSYTTSLKPLARVAEDDNNSIPPLQRQLPLCMGHGHGMGSRKRKEDKDRTTKDLKRPNRLQN